MKSRVAKNPRDPWFPARNLPTLPDSRRRLARNDQELMALPTVANAHAISAIERGKATQNDAKAGAFLFDLGGNFQELESACFGLRALECRMRACDQNEERCP